jgi:hypothetical protein
MILKAPDLSDEIHANKQMPGRTRFNIRGLRSERVLTPQVSAIAAVAKYRIRSVVAHMSQPNRLEPDKKAQLNYSYGGFK